MHGILTQLMADSEFFLRLLLAVLLGGLIGLERQSHGRPAGLRTNILVCLGSAAIIVSFQKIMANSMVDAASAIRMDPARAASGVITGIGFLGAGTIIKHKHLVRGLTSAASIWIVSAVGIALGLGQYDIAVIVTLLVLLTLFLHDKVHIKSDRYCILSIDGVGGLPEAESLRRAMEPFAVRIRNDQLALKPLEKAFTLKLHLRYRDLSEPNRILESLAGRDGITSLAWD